MSDETTPVTPVKKSKTKKTTPVTPEVEKVLPPGNSTIDKTPLEDNSHLGDNFSTPALDNMGVQLAGQEPPQIINGVVVPRVNVTGIQRRIEDSRPVGRQTSRIVGSPTVAVRFSHEGLQASVVRVFDHVNLAKEFVANPHNAKGNPRFVDPKTVHPEELQENVHKFRMRQRAPKKKQRIEAPVGSRESFETGIYQADGSAQITDPEDPATLV